MNEAHLEFLASPAWGEWLERELLPWLGEAADLGDDVLEIGPGPGLTTDIIRERTKNLMAVEADGELASALADRLGDSNVEVLHRDALDSGLPSDRFSAATCFSMLHHMPAPELQDRLFAEVHRLVRPGGVFLGTDSLDTEAIRMFHVGDIFVPMDPDTLGSRLVAAGFDDVNVERTDFELRFIARKRSPSA